jgi:hypothetical protein
MFHQTIKNCQLFPNDENTLNKIKEKNYKKRLNYFLEKRKKMLWSLSGKWSKRKLVVIPSIAFVA